jgi:hypothetical protein
MTVDPLALGPRSIPMPRAHFPTIRGEYAVAILLALSPNPTAYRWRDLMKAMEMDEELRASMHEGAVGELVREFEDEARAENEAKSILRIAAKRGIALTDEERERVLGCTDLETLNRWFDAALDATSADEIFG